MNIRETSDNIWEIKFGEDRISHRKLVVNNMTREATLYRVETKMNWRKFEETTHESIIRQWSLPDTSIQQFLTIVFKAVHM